ncbi:MAG: DUF169 domain-containing protein [Spirochaetales bacterium]|nr:DUF169 domain-containing protein [Spirochaetales bacterium]
MKHGIYRKFREFMSVFDCCPDPLAVYYTDTKPQGSVGPRGGFSIDIKGPGDLFRLAGKGASLMEEKRKRFRCLFQFLAITRKDHIPSVFDKDNFGCPGFRFYSGYTEKLPLFNHFFTSTGFPMLYKGERFAPSPSSSQRHAKLLEGLMPGGRYLVFDAMDNLPPDVDPAIVVFFCNAEALAGLVGLVRFTTDRADAVCSPFSSGCASIFSWPMKFKQENKENAVIGVFDPAARPYMTPGEMTLSMSYGLFKKTLVAYKRSFIYSDRIKGGIIKEAVPGWPAVRRRAKGLNRHH